MQIFSSLWLLHHSISQNTSTTDYSEFCGKQERDLPDTDTDGSSPDVSSAEILDEMTTRRGELKHRSVSFNDRQLQVRNSFP